MAKVTGGDKLGPHLRDLAQRLSKAKSVDVGFLAGATYPDGTSIPMVAALNEFGTSKQPPQPFFRQMIATKSPEWGDAVAGLLKINDYDAAKTLDQAGGAIAGQLRQSIVDLTSPPLAQSTIDRKGFAKPLIEAIRWMPNAARGMNSRPQGLIVMGCFAR